MSQPQAARTDTFVFYRYEPSLPAAVIFIVCFFITTALHIFQAAKSKTYYFVPLIVGGIFEFGGYVARALAHSNQQNLSIFITQLLLLLVAPALYAASIYMVLGRIIIYVQGEVHSPIRANWLTKIFVCGDVFSFLVQSGGISYISSYYITIASVDLYVPVDNEAPGGGLTANMDTMELGKNVILAGLSLQILFFGFFLFCGGLFHYRMIRSPTPASLQENWAKYMYALYTTGVLILIRSIFRVIEFIQGNNGTIMTHEIFLYLFDSILMLGVMVFFNVVHPGTIIGRKSSIDAIALSDRSNSSDGFASEPK